MNNSHFPRCLSRPAVNLDKWDKVGQKSAFRPPAITIFVTFVKDQGVKRMFTPSLRVYHVCQEVLLTPFRITLFKLCCFRIRNRGRNEAETRPVGSVSLSAASRLQDHLLGASVGHSPTALRCAAASHMTAEKRTMRDWSAANAPIGKPFQSQISNLKSEI
mgnify:FL=1